ncbi:hypothetical protein OK015_21260 [Mycobacterium sp. Aquia_216]|uniref:WXG100 family type VII secretion target n=1 Tax=Mycobacterium sp. Aquia_216 TaxID=2991729 RepID=UPI00227C12F5|nr:hypothetical protein [Mycobacterium sp. Aquia_216]WAJ43694.1 hypothetical protein OK015_21260 [Mycobacterium sp. Aquia_216]
MAGVVGVGVPSLSEIQAWDVAHLENAARDWTATAQHWETSFTSIHRASVSPGGTVWEGVAAEAAQERAFADLVKVRGLADVLHESAAIACRGAETLHSAKRSVLDVARDASAAGYVVGEDLSVTPSRGGAAAQAQAQMYAAQIRERAVQLATLDQEVAGRISAATAPLNAVTFPEPPAAPRDNKPKIHAVDLHTFKDAPNPEPEPPPGGWSNDPLMRAAQKIAYGHASGPDGHLAEFPGMTKDQLADLIHNMFTRDPKDLIVGRARDGAPVLYDPKNNVIVIRDPGGLDCGTVFKPQDGIGYVLGDENNRPKIVAREPSIPPGQLSDGPLPAPKPAPAESTPPAAPRPPVEAQPVPKSTAPSIKEGPMLPGGPGAPIGPTLAPPPHWHGPHVLGDAAEEPWEDDHH